MRLSSLSLAAILLLSSVVFAQHHEPSAPSSPPPSPPPSAAPSPAPSPAPSAAPSASTNSAASSSSSASVSHTSAPSAPPPATSAPQSHIAPSAAPVTSHVSTSISTESSVSRVAPAAHTPVSDMERVIPDTKIGGEGKIAPAPRIGENPPEKEREVRPGQSDLRRPICAGGACKEPAPKPAPPDSDLRRPICLNENCRCPAGQTASKGGCVAGPANPLPEQCQPGAWWNGGSCVPSPAECSGISGRAEILLNELRSLSAQVQDACSHEPSGSECVDLKARREQDLEQYRILQNEGTPDCRARLPEPPL